MGRIRITFVYMRFESILRNIESLYLYISCVAFRCVQVLFYELDLVLESSFSLNYVVIVRTL